MERLTDEIAESAEQAADKILDREFVQTAARTLAVQFARRLVEPIVEQCAVTCESPIELAIAFALAVTGATELDSVIFDFPYGTVGNSAGETVLRIKPQAQIGNHRVDFLLTATLYRQCRDETKVFQNQLIIETDGQAYHDETAEQLSRDRRRDRQLTDAGFPIFRFTGREVWSDPFAVAGEAVAFLRESINCQVPLADRKSPQPESALALSSVAGAGG